MIAAIQPAWAALFGVAVVVLIGIIVSILKRGPRRPPRAAAGAQEGAVSEGEPVERASSGDEGEGAE